jgi:hypothetical protein
MIFVVLTKGGDEVVRQSRAIAAESLNRFLQETAQASFSPGNCGTLRRDSRSEGFAFRPVKASRNTLRTANKLSLARPRRESSGIAGRCAVGPTPNADAIPKD